MKQMKKLLSMLLVICMVISLVYFAPAVHASLDGKVVILHSNDVHGAIDGYAWMAGLRDDYIAQGADVIIVDAGDYIQGSPYVSRSKGATAIDMMNAVGYDVATLGNHEFDYGYDNLMSILKNATFKPICGDVFKNGKSVLDGWTIIQKKGLKIGFVGLETPETSAKTNPALIQGLSFPQKEDLYQCAQDLVNEVKAAGADVVIGLFHLGVDDESAPNRSVDVYAHITGIDMIIDAHSHTVMTIGPNGEPIQSTGTKFDNIGAIVFDPATKKLISNYLVVMDDSVPVNNEVKAKAEAIMKQIDDEYGQPFAVSKVDLNGKKAPGNRTEETNLGDLIADAFLWFVQKDGALAVPAENVVAIQNGGGIRADIKGGDITPGDINAVLPFGNTVTMAYVTGADLLEVLEASTFCLPDASSGFPQIAGMKISINTGKTYDTGEQYPGSTYYGPKSIRRVRIESVNGKAFDPSAVYAVATNNFCTSGGDTYYALINASTVYDTSIPLDEAVIQYITEALNGVIDDTYAEPQGRITFTNSAEQELCEKIQQIIALLPDESVLAEDSASEVAAAIAAAEKAEGQEALQQALNQLITAARNLKFKPCTFTDVKRDNWFAPAVDFVSATGVMNGTGNNKFDPKVTMSRAMVATVLYRMSDEPSVDGLENPFTDLTKNWYKDAVIWAANAGVTKGTSADKFSPDAPITREQMATMLIRFFGQDSEPEYTDEQWAELDTTLAALFSDSGQISKWAKYSVLICKVSGIMNGDAAGTLRPKADLSRAECAQLLLNIYRIALDSALSNVEAPEESSSGNPDSEGTDGTGFAVDEPEIYYPPAA